MSSGVILSSGPQCAESLEICILSWVRVFNKSKFAVKEALWTFLLLHLTQHFGFKIYFSLEYFYGSSSTI
jgi:hypothetical protein